MVRQVQPDVVRLDVGLSPTEFELLRTLLRGRGRAFASDELLRLVWGDGYAGSEEIVRANIYRLRQKLEPAPHEPRYIVGRRGLGYRLEAQTDQTVT